jgi:hypothetical protein
MVKREEYAKNLTEGVDSVTSTDMKFSVEENGEKRDFNYSYEFSKEDKQSMLSDAMDVAKTINGRFEKKDGFNHQGLAKALWFSDEKNLQKYSTSLYQKARAEAIEELLADSNNENFSRKKLEIAKDKDEGYGSIIGNEQNNGFGVKFMG